VLPSLAQLAVELRLRKNLMAIAAQLNLSNSTRSEEVDQIVNQSEAVSELRRPYNNFADIQYSGSDTQKGRENDKEEFGWI